MSSRNKKRSSILKVPSGGSSSDNGSPSSDTNVAKVQKEKKKINFSRRLSVKEFADGVDCLTVWNTSYERSTEHQGMTETTHDSEHLVVRSSTIKQPEIAHDPDKENQAVNEFDPRSISTISSLGMGGNDTEIGDNTPDITINVLNDLYKSPRVQACWDRRDGLPKPSTDVSFDDIMDLTDIVTENKPQPKDPEKHSRETIHFQNESLSVSIQPSSHPIGTTSGHNITTKMDVTDVKSPNIAVESKEQRQTMYFDNKEISISTDDTVIGSNSSVDSLEMSLELFKGDLKSQRPHNNQKTVVFDEEILESSSAQATTRPRETIHGGKMSFYDTLDSFNFSMEDTSSSEPTESKNPKVESPKITNHPAPIDEIHQAKIAKSSRNTIFDASMQIEDIAGSNNKSQKDQPSEPVQEKKKQRASRIPERSTVKKPTRQTIYDTSMSIEVPSKPDLAIPGPSKSSTNNTSIMDMTLPVRSGAQKIDKQSRVENNSDYSRKQGCVKKGRQTIFDASMQIEESSISKNIHNTKIEQKKSQRLTMEIEPQSKPSQIAHHEGRIFQSRFTRTANESINIVGSRPQPTQRGRHTIYDTSIQIEEYEKVVAHNEGNLSKESNVVPNQTSMEMSSVQDDAPIEIVDSVQLELSKKSSILRNRQTLVADVSMDVEATSTKMSLEQSKKSEKLTTTDPVNQKSESSKETIYQAAMKMDEIVENKNREGAAKSNRRTILDSSMVVEQPGEKTQKRESPKRAHGTPEKAPLEPKRSKQDKSDTKGRPTIFDSSMEIEGSKVVQSKINKTDLGEQSLEKVRPKNVSYTPKTDTKPRQTTFNASMEVEKYEIQQSKIKKIDSLPSIQLEKQKYGGQSNVLKENLEVLHVRNQKLRPTTFNASMDIEGHGDQQSKVMDLGEQNYEENQLINLTKNLKVKASNSQKTVPRQTTFNETMEVEEHENQQSKIREIGVAECGARSKVLEEGLKKVSTDFLSKNQKLNSKSRQTAFDASMEVEGHEIQQSKIRQTGVAECGAQSKGLEEGAKKVSTDFLSKSQKLNAKSRQTAFDASMEVEEHKKLRAKDTSVEEESKIVAETPLPSIRFKASMEVENDGILIEKRELGHVSIKDTMLPAAKDQKPIPMPRTTTYEASIEIDETKTDDLHLRPTEPVDASSDFRTSPDFARRQPDGRSILQLTMLHLSQNLQRRSSANFEKLNKNLQNDESLDKISDNLLVNDTSESIPSKSSNDTQYKMCSYGNLTFENFTIPTEETSNIEQSLSKSENCQSCNESMSMTNNTMSVSVIKDLSPDVSVRLSLGNEIIEQIRQKALRNTALYCKNCKCSVESGPRLKSGAVKYPFDWSKFKSCPMKELDLVKFEENYHKKLAEIRAGVDVDDCPTKPEHPGIGFLLENYREQVKAEAIRLGTERAQYRVPAPLPENKSYIFLIKNKIESENLPWYITRSLHSSVGLFQLRHNRLKSAILSIWIKKDSLENKYPSPFSYQSVKFIRNHLHPPTSPFTLEVLNEFLKIHPFEASLLYLCDDSNQLFVCLEKLNEIIIDCDNRVRRLFSILIEYEAKPYTENGLLRAKKTLLIEEELAVFRISMDLSDIENFSPKHIKSQPDINFQSKLSKITLQGVPFLEYFLSNIQNIVLLK